MSEGLPPKLSEVNFIQHMTIKLNRLSIQDFCDRLPTLFDWDRRITNVKCLSPSGDLIVCCEDHLLRAVGLTDNGWIWLDSYPES